MLAVGFDDGRVKLRDARSHEREIGCLNNPGPVVGVCMSPNGSLLACGYTDMAVKYNVWDLATQAVKYSLSTVSMVCKLTFSHDSTKLVSPGGAMMSDVVIWDSETGEKLNVFQPSMGLRVTAFCFGHDDAHLIVAYGNSPISVVNASNGVAVSTLERDRVFPVTQVVCCPNSTHCFTEESSNEIMMWNYLTGEMQKSFSVLDTIAEGISMGRTGKELIVPTQLGITVWNIETEEKTSEIACDYEVSMISFNRTDNSVAACSSFERESIFFADIASKNNQKPQLEDGNVTCLDYSDASAPKSAKGVPSHGGATEKKDKENDGSQNK
jgi:WD40 repeat protein